VRNSIVFELEFFSAARHPMCASHLSNVCLLRAGNRAACWSPVGGHIRSAMCAHKGHAGVARHVLEAMSLWDPAALVANAMHDIRDAATFTVYAFVHARRMYTACLSSMIWVPGMSREAAGRRDGREISPLIVSHLVETCLVKIVIKYVINAHVQIQDFVNELSRSDSAAGHQWLW
jgi:hypothetical protein